MKLSTLTLGVSWLKMYRQNTLTQLGDALKHTEMTVMRGVLEDALQALVALVQAGHQVDLSLWAKLIASDQHEAVLELHAGPRPKNNPLRRNGNGSEHRPTTKPRGT